MPYAIRHRADESVPTTRESHCRAASYRRDQHNAIALFEGAGFATKEADVFFVEVNIEELADLALIVADVARESGEAGSKLVESFGNRGSTTVHSGRAFGEAAEGGGNFDSDGHF